MNEVQVFNNTDFGEIRTIIIDGEPWFVGKDIAERLGYVQTANMLKLIDVEDKQKFAVSKMDPTNNFVSRSENDTNKFVPSKMDDTNNKVFSSMTRQLIIINEGGLYKAIFGSKLQNAKNFKDWVTKEVLPTIRKTGSYGQPQLPQTPMELLELHYEAIKQVDHKVDEVKAEFEQFKQEIPIFGEECSEINAVVEQKVVECLGGQEFGSLSGEEVTQKIVS